MTTEYAFLADIIAKPEDDLPRLVFADWLDENGQEERARWIRIQVELERTMPDRRPWYIPGNWPDEVRPTSKQNLERHIWRQAVESEEVFDWFRVFDHNFTAAAYVGRMSGGDPETGGTDDRLAIVRRGFVDEIRCTLAEWCGGEECPECVRYEYVRGVPTVQRLLNCRHCHGTGRTPGIGPQVVRKHPVTKVVLIDVIERSAWSGSTAGAVTIESAGPLFDVAFPPFPDGRLASLGGYIEAHADVLEGVISTAAIKWAKSQVPHLSTTPVTADLTQ